MPLASLQNQHGGQQVLPILDAHVQPLRRPCRIEGVLSPAENLCPWSLDHGGRVRSAAGSHRLDVRRGPRNMFFY